MLSNNVSIRKWHVGHLYHWKPGINDHRISSSPADKGDTFMEVTRTGFRGLPQPRAGTDKSRDLLKTEHTLHSARWHKWYLTKDTPAEGSGKKPHSLTALRVRRKHLGLVFSFSQERTWLVLNFESKETKIHHYLPHNCKLSPLPTSTMCLSTGIETSWAVSIEKNQLASKALLLPSDQ